MSTIPNYAGNFLSNSSPYISNYAAIASPWGTVIKPGGRVAAYVRSTGAQDGDDQFAFSGQLVTSINEGLKRCRSGQNDIVFVLPGHVETYSSAGAVWANLVAGAQIISCGSPGATNNPTLTLSQAAASLAFNVANVTFAGFNISSSTAALSAAIVITGSGCTFAGNYIVCTGAGAANSLLTITSAANVVVVGNNIVQDSTAAIVTVTGATSTNFIIQGNQIRQAQGTSGGAMITTASTTGISGIIANNNLKSATAITAGATAVVLGANTVTTVANIENYVASNTAAAGILATGA